MSTNLISGLQGSGKSFFCARHIIDQLRDTERHIYTNVSIHPDRIACIVLRERYAKTRQFFWASKVDLILSRIHIFKAFTSRAEYLRFKKINPLYCALHRNRDRSLDKSKTGLSQKLLFHLSEIMEFWDVSRSNCIFYFDESYQFWRSSDGAKRDKDTKERRERLQTYILHHRHFDDDVYVISHKEEYLDKNILFSVRYVVRNMRDYPIIPDDILAKYWWLRLVGSITRPYQFFRAHVFVGDEKKYKSTQDVWPSKKIFDCYDSKAPAETLGKVITHDQEKAVSGNYGRSWFRDLRDWFRDSWTQLLLAFFVVYTVISIFYNLFKADFGDALNSTFNKKGSSDSQAVKQPEGSKKSKPLKKGQGGKASEPEPEKEKKVTAVSPNAIYFSDGSCIRKGCKYEIKGVLCDVIGVDNNFVEFACQGKRFRISVRLLSRI
jgi:hypothetical protein